MTDSNTNYVNYLIELSQLNRRNAFLELCEFNQDYIYGLCLRITADKQLAENFTKKIFTTAWTEIKNFRKGVNFSVWLKGIAVFTLLNTMDDLKDKPDAGEIKIETGSADTDVLEDKIISLAREERIPFVLHDVEGYSYSEISDLISQLSIDEIKLKVRTARNKIIEGLYR